MIFYRNPCPPNTCTCGYINVPQEERGQLDERSQLTVRNLNGLTIESLINYLRSRYIGINTEGYFVDSRTGSPLQNLCKTVTQKIRKVLGDHICRLKQSTIDLMPSGSPDE